MYDTKGTQLPSKSFNNINDQYKLNISTPHYEPSFNTIPQNSHITPDHAKGLTQNLKDHRNLENLQSSLGKKIFIPHNRMHSCVFICFLFLELAVNFDSGAIPAILVILEKDFGISDLGQGVLGCIPYIGLVLSGPFVGHCFQLFSKKKVLLITLTANLMATILFACSYTAWVLFLSRSLIGLTQSGLSIYTPIWVDEFAPKDKVTLWISLTQAGVVLGSVTGYLMSGFLRNSNKNWRWAIFIQCISIFILVTTLFLIPSRYIDFRLCRKIDFENLKKENCVSLNESSILISNKNTMEFENHIKDQKFYKPISFTSLDHMKNYSNLKSKVLGNRAEISKNNFLISENTNEYDRITNSNFVVSPPSDKSVGTLPLSIINSHSDNFQSSCSNNQLLKDQNNNFIQCPDNSKSGSLFVPHPSIDVKDIISPILCDPQNLNTFQNLYPVSRNCNYSKEKDSKPEFFTVTQFGDGLKNGSNSTQNNSISIAGIISNKSVELAKPVIRCSARTNGYMIAIKPYSIGSFNAWYVINDSNRKANTLKNEFLELMKEQSIIGEENFSDIAKCGETRNNKGLCSELVCLLKNPIYVWVTVALCTLFFEVTGIQFWSTRFFEEVVKAETKMVLIWFAITASTAPILGVLLGGILIDKLGGYKTYKGVFRTLLLCAVFAFLAFILGILAYFQQKFITIIILVWLILFIGGSIMPATTGITISAVDPDMRPIASALSITVYNIFGHILGTSLPGILIEASNLKTGMGAIFLSSGVGLLGILIAAGYAWKYGKRDAVESTNSHNCS